MTKDYCEKCGVKLTEANRSKAYRNRCKRCVANYEREKRQECLFPKEKRTEITHDIAKFVMKEAEKFGVSVEQSRKLAEILPIESADMYWWPTSLRYYIEAMDDGDFNEEEGHVRAWSLAALLAILPFPVLYMEMLGGMILWSCECHFMETDEVVKMEHYDNPVDACVAMIEKLHELKLL